MRALLIFPLAFLVAFILSACVLGGRDDAMMNEQGRSGDDALDDPR